MTPNPTTETPTPTSCVSTAIRCPKCGHHCWCMLNNHPCRECGHVEGASQLAKSVASAAPSPSVGGLPDGAPDRVMFRIGGGAPGWHYAHSGLHDEMDGTEDLGSIPSCKSLGCTPVEIVPDGSRARLAALSQGAGEAEPTEAEQALEWMEAYWRDNLGKGDEEWTISDFEGAIEDLREGLVIERRLRDGLKEMFPNFTSTQGLLEIIEIHVDIAKRAAPPPPAPTGVTEDQSKISKAIAYLQKELKSDDNLCTCGADGTPEGCYYHDLMGILWPPPESRLTPSGSAWNFDMEAAPKDGTWVLAQCAKIIDPRLAHYSGRFFVVKFIASDEGWSLFPGFGGCPDGWFSKWMPLPAAPVTPKQGE